MGSGVPISSPLQQNKQLCNVLLLSLLTVKGLGEAVTVFYIEWGDVSWKRSLLLFLVAEAAAVALLL